MRRAGLALVLFCLAAELTGCGRALFRGGPGKGRVVEAEGWTPIDSANPLETKRRAIAEAQKNAVEQVMGVSVSATTKVEAAVTSEQKILANIGGYIRNYEILSEREEEGFLKIRIRALVLFHPPKPASSAASGVRLAVLCEDKNLSVVIEAHLSERGFTLEQSAADADYSIRASANVFVLADSGVAGLSAGRARVVLDVSETKTKGVFQHVREASALDPVEAVAREKAASVAARLASEDLASRIFVKLGIEARAPAAKK
ncbi:MAG: hypothetical protein AAB036_11300 [Elusimicrobiota bacterium]